MIGCYKFIKFRFILSSNLLTLMKNIRLLSLALLLLVSLTVTIAAPLNEQMAFCKDQIESKYFQGSYERTKTYNECMNNADRLIQEYEKNKIRKAELDRIESEKIRVFRENERRNYLEKQRQFELERQIATAIPRGPSDSYGGRIRARIKPNISFREEIESNSPTEVEVRCSPDGTIIGIKIIKSSGNVGWDRAVTTALEKTAILPRDIDGSVHSPLVISFRPKD